MGQAFAQTNALCVAEGGHDIFKIVALHTGDAFRADLFLVGEDADGGLFGLVEREERGEFCKSADAVVMAVGADQAAVESNVTGVRRGDSFQLGGDEVLLGDAVFLVQQTQDFDLDAVRAVVIAERAGANEDIERFGRDGLIEGLFALFAAKVREQIVDDELGVLGVVADLDVDFAAVAADDKAVQLERDGDPLVFADAAVVVRLEVGQLGILVEGIGLEVEPRRVGVGRADVRALGERLLADDHEHDGLAAVVVVELVAGGDGHARRVGLEALRLGEADGGDDAFAFGLRDVEEGLVLLAVVVHFRFFDGADAVEAVLGLV